MSSLPVALVLLAALLGAPVAERTTPPVPERTTLVAIPGDLPGTLPAGSGGAVAVVARSAVLGAGDRVVAVIRNGTGRTVAGVAVTATVRGDDGAVVATGTAADAAPVAIPAGGLGLALIRLDRAATPTARIGFTVTATSGAAAATPQPGAAARMDVALPFLARDGDALTGGATAIAIDAAHDPVLLVACLDPADPATVTGYARAALQPTRIDPYRTIPVRLTLPPGCVHLLAAVTAHA